MMITRRTCGSFLLNVEECVHQRTRQGVIILKSLILLKLGTIVGSVEILPSTRISVAILNFLGDTRSPRSHLKMTKSAHFFSKSGLLCLFVDPDSL